MSDLKIKLASEFLADEDYAYGYCDDFQNVYIATQIKVLREQRGYATQTAFANEKNIKQPQLSHLEDIDTNSWSVNTLRRIARALGVTVRVSFESFSSAIETIENFKRETLQRPSRVEDLARFSGGTIADLNRISPENVNRIVETAYADTMNSNGGQQGLPAVAAIKKPTVAGPLERKKTNETPTREPSPSDMAISAKRIESKGARFSEHRAY